MKKSGSKKEPARKGAARNAGTPRAATTTSSRDGGSTQAPDARGRKDSGAFKTALPPGIVMRAVIKSGNLEKLSSGRVRRWQPRFLWCG